MNEETEKLYATLAAQREEIANLREGYVIVNRRYSEALDALNVLEDTTTDAATRAAIAADRAALEAANAALAAREKAAAVVIATAKAAAENVAEVAYAAAGAAALAAAAATEAATLARDSVAQAIKRIGRSQT